VFEGPVSRLEKDCKKISLYEPASLAEAGILKPYSYPSKNTPEHSIWFKTDKDMIETLKYSLK